MYVGSGIIPNYPVECKPLLEVSDCMTDKNGVQFCQNKDPFGRDPFYCVLKNAGDPPQLDPDPPACTGCTPASFSCVSNSDCCSGVCNANLCN
jgi:hypothetical protein